MPPKGKVALRAKEPEAKEPSPPPPKTVAELSRLHVSQTRPLDARVRAVGISGLTPAERAVYLASHYVRKGRAAQLLGSKAQKEVWRTANESSLPLRALEPGEHDWGWDKFGRPLGEYSLEEWEERQRKSARLTSLEALRGIFEEKRDWAQRRAAEGGHENAPAAALTDEDVEEERERRQEIAQLRMELYGTRTDPFALDPAWDDITPLPQEDPEGALAAIAYPEHYAEAMGYLRAIMIKQEYSARALRLTEHIIAQNPAHYTVWLYRFSIISAMHLPIPDEIAWLNDVSMRNLKNYQIWQHRQLLLEALHKDLTTTSSSSSELDQKLADLARSETDFITDILAEDTKNYHVWSYRQYLVRKLGRWGPEERHAVERMVDEDVRNNSAWSHRFFLVFSDPAYATPGVHSTAHDPGVPADVVDREVGYAMEKIDVAPQNQSPWNYLRGALAKGGRKLAGVEGFAASFVEDVGAEAEGKEQVRSTHALDFLADAFAEKGETDKADLYLRRLGEKWDPVRLGYWEWRRRSLKA